MISINDFEFEFAGYGRYKVTYTSPKTWKKWSRIINDMRLIDRTKNEVSPKVKDLVELKFVTKN